MVAPSELKNYEQSNLILFAAQDGICDELRHQLSNGLHIDRFLDFAFFMKYLFRYEDVAGFLENGCSDADAYRLMY